MESGTSHRGFWALVVLTVLAASPAFLDFVAPKLAVAGVGCAWLCWTHRHVAWPRTFGWLWLVWLGLSLPGFIAAASVGHVLLALALDGVFLVAVAVGSILGRNEQPLPVPSTTLGTGGHGSCRRREFRVGGVVPSTIEPARWLAYAQLGVVLLWSLDGIVLDGPLAFGGLPGSSPLGNPDHVAEFSVLGLISAGFLWPSRGKGREVWLARGVAGAAAAAALWILIRVGGATAWVSLAAALCFLGFRWVLGRRSFLWRWAFPVVLLLGAAAAWHATPLPGEVQRRFYLFEVSFDAVAESPVRALIGLGVGGFPGGYLDAQGLRMVDRPKDRPWWTNARHPHNAPLWWWSERGLAAAVFAGVVLLWGAARIWWKGPSFPGAMLAALAVVAVGSKWSGSVPVALLAGGCLGAGLGLQRREENTTASSRGNRWLATLRAVVLACFLLVVCLASAASNLLTGAGRPDSALAVWPFDTSARLRLGLSTESCEDIAVSHSVEPDLYKGLALGNCLARRNQHEAARDTYRQVLAWKPDHAAAHGNLAVALKALGDLDGAWRHGRRALSLRPSDPSIRRIWKHVCEGNVHCER